MNVKSNNLPFIQKFVQTFPDRMVIGNSIQVVSYMEYNTMQYNTMYCTTNTIDYNSI